MDITEIKNISKEQIKGKIGILLVIAIIIALISCAAMILLSFIPGVGPLISAIIISPAFTLSLTRVYLGITNGNTPVVEDAFSGFDDFWSVFKVTFLMGIFTYLWALLFIIPGIIKSFSYSMSVYILAENKGKPALECINESKRITQGHKLELFVLGLSFIGWILVGYITLGIAFVWIVPYMQTSFANAYKSLKANAEINVGPEII